MPKTEQPKEVRGLIADWLKYTKEKTAANTEYEPSDEDLKSFLVSKGYDSKAVEQQVAKLPEKEKSDEKKDSTESNIEKAKRPTRRKSPSTAGLSGVSEPNDTTNKRQPKKDSGKVAEIKKRMRLLNKKELKVLKRELKNGA